MAKGQKRNNREVRKPKQNKKAPTAQTIGASGSGDPIRAIFTPKRNSVRTRP